LARPVACVYPPKKKLLADVKLIHEFAGFVQVTEAAGVGSERGLDQPQVLQAFGGEEERVCTGVPPRLGASIPEVSKRQAANKESFSGEGDSQCRTARRTSASR
jgi:hypothetical protein